MRQEHLPGLPQQVWDGAGPEGASGQVEGPGWPQFVQQDVRGPQAVELPLPDVCAAYGTGASSEKDMQGG